MATAGAVKPIPPVKLTPPATPTVPTMVTIHASVLYAFNTYDLYRTEYQEYKQKLDTYLLYHNTSKCLVNQIVVIVPLL